MAELTINGPAATAVQTPKKTQATTRGQNQSPPPDPELEHAYGVVFSKDTIEGVIRHVLDACDLVVIKNETRFYNKDCGAEAAMCVNALVSLLGDLGRRRLLKALWRRVDQVVKVRHDTKAAAGLIDEELLALIRRARIELFESRAMH